MNRKILCLTLVGLPVTLYGCSARSGSEPATPTATTATAAAHEHTDHTSTGEASMSHADMHEMMAGLAKLPPEDRASADQQHICPVSGEMLGKMGPPVKVDVNGQQVWICCESCKDELLTNADKYLAKLKAAHPKE